MSYIQQVIPEFTVVLEAGTVNSAQKNPGIATIRQNMPSVLNVPNCSMTLSGFGNIPDGIEITSNNNRFTVSALPRILMTPSIQIPQFESQEDKTITTHVNRGTTLWGAAIDTATLQLPNVVTPIPMHQWGLAAQAPWTGGVAVTGTSAAASVTNPIFAYTVSNVYGLVGVNQVGHNFLESSIDMNLAGALDPVNLQNFGSFFEDTVQNSLGQKMWFPTNGTDTIVPKSWLWTPPDTDVIETLNVSFNNLVLFSPDNWLGHNAGVNNFISYLGGHFLATDPALGNDWNNNTYGFGAMTKFIMNSLYYSCPDMGQNPYAMGGPILDFNRFNAVTVLNKANTFKLPLGSHSTYWLPLNSATYTEADKTTFTPFWHNLGVSQQNYIESQLATNTASLAAMEPSHFMAVMTQNLCKHQPYYNFETNNSDNGNSNNPNTNSVWTFEEYGDSARVAATMIMAICLLPTKIYSSYASPVDNPLDQYLYNSGFRSDLQLLLGNFWSGGTPDTNVFNHYQDLSTRFTPTLYCATSASPSPPYSYSGSGRFSTAFTYGIMSGALSNTPATFNDGSETYGYSLNPWAVIEFNNGLLVDGGIEDLLYSGSAACNLPRIMYNMAPPVESTNTVGTPPCTWTANLLVAQNDIATVPAPVQPRQNAHDAVGVSAMWVLPPCFGCFNLPEEHLGTFAFNPYCSGWFSTVGGRPGVSGFTTIHYDNAPVIGGQPNPFVFPYGSNYMVNYAGSILEPSAHFKTNMSKPFRPDAPYDTIMTDAPFTLDHQYSYPRTMGYIMPRKAVLASTKDAPYIHPINNSRNSVMNESLTHPSAAYTPIIGHTYPPFINKRGNGLFQPGWPSPPHVVTLSSPRPLVGNSREGYTCVTLTSDDPSMICPKADLSLGACMTYGTCDFPINQAPLEGLLPMMFNMLPHSTLLSQPDIYQAPVLPGEQAKYTNIYNHHVSSSTGIMPMPCGTAQDIRYVCNMRMATIMQRSETDGHDYSNPMIWKHTFVLPTGTYTLAELEITLNELLNTPDENDNFPFFKKIDLSECMLTSCDYEDDNLSWRGPNNTATYPAKNDALLAKGNRYGPPTTGDEGIGIVVTQGPNTKNKFFGAQNFAFVLNQNGMMELQQTSTLYNLAASPQAMSSKLNTTLSSIFWSISPGGFDPYFAPLWGDLGQGTSIIDPFMLQFSSGLEPLDVFQATTYQPPGTTPAGTTGNISIGASYQSLISAYNNGFLTFDANSIADAGAAVIYGSGAPSNSLFQSEINYNASNHLYLGAQSGAPDRTASNPYNLSTQFTSLGPGKLTDGLTPCTPYTTDYNWSTSPAAIALNHRRLNYYEQAMENIASGRVFNICGGNVSFIPAESDIQLISLANVEDVVEVNFWKSLGFTKDQLTLFTPAISHIKPVEGLVYSAQEETYVGAPGAFCFSKEDPDLQFTIPDIYIRTIPDMDIDTTSSASITTWLNREFPQKFRAQILMDDVTDIDGNTIANQADGALSCAHPMMLFAPQHMATIANRKNSHNKTLLQDLCDDHPTNSVGFFDWYVYPSIAGSTHQSFSVCVFGALSYLPILGGQLARMSTRFENNIWGGNNHYALVPWTLMSVVEMLTINPYLYQGALPFDMNYHYSGNIFSWRPLASLYMQDPLQATTTTFYESGYLNRESLSQIDVPGQASGAEPFWPAIAPTIPMDRTRWDFPNPRSRIIASAGPIPVYTSTSHFDYQTSLQNSGLAQNGFMDDCKLVKGSNMQWPTQAPWMLDPYELQLPIQTSLVPRVQTLTDSNSHFPQRTTARDAACIAGPCPPRYGFTNMLAGSGLGSAVPLTQDFLNYNNSCGGFYQNMNFIIQHFMQTRTVTAQYTFDLVNHEVTRTGYTLQTYHDNWALSLPSRITGTALTTLRAQTAARNAEYYYNATPFEVLTYDSNYNAVDYITSLAANLENNAANVANGWIIGLGQQLLYGDGNATVSQDLLFNPSAPMSQVPMAGRIVLDEIAACAINQKPMTGFKGITSNPCFSHMQNSGNYEKEKVMESRTCKTFGIVTNYRISQNSKGYLGPNYNNTDLEGMTANAGKTLINTLYTTDSDPGDLNSPNQVTSYTTNFLAAFNLPRVITPIFTSGMIVSVAGPSFSTVAQTIYGERLFNNAVLLSVSNNFANMNSVTFSSALVCTLANQNIPYIEVNLIDPSTGTPVTDFSYLHLVLTFTPTNAPTAQQISFAQGLSVADVLGQTGMATDSSTIVGSPAVTTPVNTNIKRARLTPQAPNANLAPSNNTSVTRMPRPPNNPSTSNNQTFG